MAQPPRPIPIFDSLDIMIDVATHHRYQTIDLPYLSQAIYLHAHSFLCAYRGSPDTFASYRREVERFFQWSSLIAKKNRSNKNRRH